MQSTKPRYESNFRAINKISLKAKATTCRAQSAFRRRPGKQLPQFDEKKRDLTVLLPEEEHPYGKKNRPSTPVGDVVSNYYGVKATEMIESKYGYLAETKKPLGMKYSYGNTRATAMAHQAIKDNEWSKSREAGSRMEVFKMKKFKLVKPRTETYNHRKFTS